MPDGNDGDDQSAVIDLIDSAVVADADAPCNLHGQYTINRPDFRTRRQ